MPSAEAVAVALLNGVTWGFAVALLAVGLNLIFGLMEVINIAHGALYMLGAVTAWATVDATGSFVLAVLVAPLAVGAMGVAFERTVLRPIEERLAATLLVTFGAMLAVEHGALVLFGAGTRTVGAPVVGSVRLAGVAFPAYRLVVAVMAASVLAGLHLLVRRTRVGLWMRGVRQDSETAAALGVPRHLVYSGTFGLGAAFAGLAGALMAPIVGVHHLMGRDVLAVAFVVVIAGGLGSFRGVLVASLGFTLVENLAALELPSVQARLLAFGVMLGVVVLRPGGVTEEGVI